MDQLSAPVFAVLFATMGPLKTIPVFHDLSLGLSYARLATLALAGALFAGVIVGFVSFVTLGKMQALGVTSDALGVAGGAILFAAGLRRLTDIAPATPLASAPVRAPADDRPSLMRAALWPLAAPTIVTPAAVVAILVFLERTLDDGPARYAVLQLIGLMLLMNLAGMLAARPIVRVIGSAPLRIVGWIFSVLQTGMGVEVAIAALRRMLIAS